MFKRNIDASVEDASTFGKLRTMENKERVVPTLAGRWRNFYENVADVLNHGAKPLVSLPSLRRAIAVLDASIQSAQSGEVVHVNLPALQE